MIAELQRHHGIALDLNALRGIVQNVAVFCPHLTGDDSHAGSQAVNADGARTVGHILSVGRADHAAIRVGHKELDIGDGCTGHGVLFDNEQRTHFIVAKSHGNDVLILAGEIDRFRGVGDHIPVRRGDLLADVSACLEAGHNNGSIARSAVLTDDRATRTGGAAKVADSKPCTFQRLATFAVHLADDDGRKGRIFKGQHLALATGNEALLRGWLFDGVAVRRFQLRYLVPAILDLRKNDFSACVRKVSAEVVELTGVGVVAAIPDLELGTLDGIAGDTVHLANLQAGLESVEEGDGRCLTGFQRYLLRNGAENDMTGNIDLRDLECADRDRVEENAAMVIGGGAGGKAAVDLLDTESDALDRFPVGNVLLDNFKTGLFVVHKGDLGDFSGAQRHGLLRIAHDVRLRYGFLTHNIDTGRNGRERCGTVRASRDGGGIIAGDGLHREHCADDGLAAHGVALDDLHIGLFVVDRRNSVFAVTLSYIYVHALRRGIDTVTVRCSGFHEAPKAGGGVLNIDLTLRIGNVAADDLPVEIDAETCTGETGCGSTGSFFQYDLANACRRCRFFSAASGLILSDQFAGTIIIEERLIFAIAGDCVHCPFCTLVLHNGCRLSLCSELFNLTLELGILLRLLLQKPVDEAQIQIIGVGVGVTARVAVSTGLAFIGLVLPNVGLYRHKELADVGFLAVVEVGHHPLDILNGRGIHLAETAVRERQLQYGICICTGAGRPCKGIEVRRCCIVIAKSAIHAVHELAVHQRRAVAVRGTVGKQACAPICLVGGNFEAGTRVRRGKSRSRQQAQDRHQRKQ